MSTNERIRKLCRICGDVGSVNVFGSLGQSMDLSDKMNFFLKISVTINDRFSTMVCDACVHQITSINHIVEMGIHTNDLMLKLLEKKDCVSPDDQLSLKICHDCANLVEDAYPIFEFSRNTTKLMSMIIGNITWDDLKIDVASEAVKTFREDVEFDLNKLMIQENNNKENETENFCEEENDNSVLMPQKTFENTTQIQCLRCTDTFISGTQLRRHILLSHSLKDLDCHHCFRRCSNELEFENHVKLHFISVYPYYPCDICLNSFESLATLISHIKKHKGPRTKDWALSYNVLDKTSLFGCRHCNKTFILEASRRIHERIHLTCLICETCGKQLANKSQLNVHQRQHTGERPYECTHCGSSFKCLSTLRQHEVVHFEKKYNCEVCLRKFSRPEKVRIHMRVHTGEKPYNCLMCHKKYQQKNDLNRHMKKKHGQHYMMKNLR